MTAGSTIDSARRVVFVCCDGLARDWITPDLMPALHAFLAASTSCAAHHAVFPSVTRVSAASVATGCLPASHGLHGNRMGLPEDGKIVVRDVGHPDFRAHMRRATGSTLRVPTLAQRVAGKGGFIAYSNVSPGAAYFLDPDHFGHVYHRAGSYAPGGQPITGLEALDVSHDLAGDRAMTRRFCEDILPTRKPAIALLWLSNPDLTMHAVPLGSAMHVDALRQTDQRVAEVIAAVEGLRTDGADVLLMVGSDHGQESIGGYVNVEAWLCAHGLQDEVLTGQVAVAGQGTAALLYAVGAARARVAAVLGRLAEAPWVDAVVAAHELPRVGLSDGQGIVAAINTARTAHENPHGVRGMRWSVVEPGKPGQPGVGQHGGWGPDETRPFLALNHAAYPPAVLSSPTSLIDIAPTALDFLGIAAEGIDGLSIARLLHAPDVEPRVLLPTMAARCMP
ncbi:alkaline phosphatase family protein [Bordetella genomosp. 13]|uniref:alkaline phosphatase family protein n=1 Tax=Bordetella genomosp. 13 TaxID=463040 RepID=UPI0011A59D43|nr:alkaline phosphatase family protein [Bordetella genomosp. 13]